MRPRSSLRSSASARLQTKGTVIKAEDLRVYEQNHQGHTVSVHVNNAPGADADRLSRQPHIAASGSFTDLDTAQTAVNAAVAHWEGSIREWLRSGSQAKFVKELYFDHPVGSCLTRSEFVRGIVDATPATGVRLVLKRSNEFPSGFCVLTAYPVIARTQQSAIPATPPLSIAPSAENRLANQVGLNTNQLIERLENEPWINAASCFADLEIAQHAVDGALAARSDDLNDWLLSTNKSYGLTVSVPYVVGVSLSRRALERGQTQPAGTNRPHVIVERSADAPGGFAVRNAYPVLPWRLAS